MSHGQVQSRSYNPVAAISAYQPLAVQRNLASIPERDQGRHDALLSYSIAYSDIAQVNGSLDSESALDEAIARSLQEQFDLEANLFAAAGTSSAAETPRSLLGTEPVEPPSPEIVEPLPEENVLEDNFVPDDARIDRGRLIGPVTCRRCRASLPVHPWDPSSSKGTAFGLQLACPQCHHRQCRGCLRDSPLPILPSSTPASTQPPPYDSQLQCCPQIRTVALFELLCTFDELYLQFLDPSNAFDCRTRQQYLTNMLKSIHDPARKWEKQIERLLTRLQTVLEMQAGPLCPKEFFQVSFIMELFDWFMQEEQQLPIWVSHHTFYSAIIVTMSALIKTGYSSLFTASYSRIKGGTGLRSTVAGDAVVESENQQETPALINDPLELHYKRTKIINIAHKMTVPSVADKLDSLARNLTCLLFDLAVY